MADKVQKWKNRKKISWAGWLFIFLFSLIAGFSVSAVVVTGGDAWDFYDSGDVWEVSLDKYLSAESNISYQMETEMFTILNDQAQITLMSYGKNNSWKYSKMILSNLSAGFLEATFHYYERKGDFIGSKTFHLSEGENCVSLNADRFSYIIVDFQNQGGNSFALSEFQIMTQNDEIDQLYFWRVGFVASLLLGVMLYFFVVYIGTRNVFTSLYVPVVGLQKIYIKFGEILPVYSLKLSFKWKHRIRIFLFTLLFLILTILNVFNLFMVYEFHKYGILSLCIILLILAFLSIESKLKIQNWKNALVVSWLTLWCITAVSDFIVKKREPIFSFNGYIMIFLMGFLFFTWNQKKDRKIIWDEICKAVEVTFLLAVLFCLICRPDLGGVRYNGAYTNPNPFGLYLAVTGCVFLSEFDQYIRNRKYKFFKLIGLSFCMSAVLFFLYKTQCMTAILALALAIVFWLSGYLRKGIFKQFKKKFIAVVSLTIFLYIPVSIGLQWGISTLPYTFDTTVEYPKDLRYTKNIIVPQRDIVYAAEINILDLIPNDRIVYKLKNAKSLNDLLSGRLNHFVTYLKDMNLFGHAERPEVYGTNIKYAHNGVLAYAHSYGILVLVPYVFMYVCFLSKAFIFWKKRMKYDAFSYLPISIGIVFSLENMMDNVDIPFHWIVWFVFMFVMGTFFDFSEKIES